MTEGIALISELLQDELGNRNFTHPPIKERTKDVVSSMRIFWWNCRHCNLGTNQEVTFTSKREVKRWCKEKFNNKCPECGHTIKF